MSRPRINDNDKRIIQVNIRITEAENAKLVAFAQASGMSTANFVRKIVFTGKFPKPKLSPIHANLYRELNKIGVNLNQITHKINQGDHPAEIYSVQVELSALLKKTLNVLLDDRQPDQG
ncbi:plasmid mobilization protein [Pseudochryseolinea flava]|uniref:Mobilisation protein (MobC) n=1 Tax=Pseudochryseolinea flava TaxID=2059302 RepID=A0A364XZD7_9BACT|nr:plasmid mobilization relaxosome protein MobC [Pseudochryseolinea flava]RAV99665.1 hypothetical protein DQQ10_18905 [Pseudochryseolinea flava]